MSILAFLKRTAGLLLSNFKAITASSDYSDPYDEIGAQTLVEVTGYKPAFFRNIGKVCIALTILDLKKMAALIDELSKNGKFDNKKQRALKANAFDVLVNDFEEFKKKKNYVFQILSCYIFPSIFKDVEVKSRGDSII